MLDSEERGVHSVFLIFPLSLWGKGFKSIYLVHFRGMKPTNKQVAISE
eukprot:COSAG02_NODE_67939_length_251_cov_2.368421_2_plen_47_part_01